MAAATAGQLLLLHILIMGIISLFFLFTVAGSILLIMILLASEISGEFVVSDYTGINNYSYFFTKSNR
jgi:hypothetical protein